MVVTTLDIGKEKPEFDLPSWKDVKEFFPLEKPRKYQDIALRTIIGAFESGTKHVFLEAPTGFGKSPLAIGLAKHFSSQEKSSYILVSSKYLQDQYIKEFETMTAKGRSNFRCPLNVKIMCNSARCVTDRDFFCGRMPRARKSPPKHERVVGISSKRGKLCLGSGASACPYWRQKCAAMLHPSPVLNYDYFLNETAHVGDFGRRSLMVCDEAHNIESKLMGFVGFSLSSRDLNLINQKMPHGLEAGEWASILDNWAGLFKKKIEQYEDRMDKLTPPEADMYVRLVSRAERSFAIAREMEEDPGIWVVDIKSRQNDLRLSETVSFRPVFIRKWANLLFSKADNFLMQSATILDSETMANSLGLDKEDVLHVSVPSIFARERRQIVYRGVGKMSWASKETTMPCLVKEVENIITRNPEEKGVVHTHNYAIQRELLRGINSRRMLSNDSAETRDDVFREFINSKEPLVLVTPSAYEGVDFKGPACRWQVLCKVPYPPLYDPQIKKRMELDRKWYSWLTALKLVQTYGRGMRSEDDFCETYILDSNFRDFFHRNQKIFPGWFRDAIVWNSKI